MALIMAVLMINVILFGVCELKGESKSIKSLELNEEQFLDNIERAKKGETGDGVKPNYVMSNEE